MPARMTQQAFARRIGISYRTVSRVFNDHPQVSARTRETVLREARRLGFRRHPGARGLRMKKTFTVGMILQNEPLSFWSRILAHLERDLREDGYYLVVCHRRDEAAGSEDELTYLLDREVDAIILVPSPSDKPKGIRPALAAGKPLLQLDQKIRGVAGHFLGTDSYAGSRELCRHLLDMGHRQIAFITGPRRQYTSRRREEGYRAAMADSGASIREQFVYEGQTWDRAEGERAADYYLGLKHRPSAIMAANDVIAMGAHLRLRRRGLSLPRDMSLAGYAGELDGELVTPALTTVVQPAELLGTRAAERIVDLMENAGQRPTCEEVADCVVLRESVGPPGQAWQRAQGQTRR